MKNSRQIRSITLVRHGMTSWAESGRHTSITDIDLNDTGREQAVKLRPYFAARRQSYDGIYTSPLLRARHTAALAGFEPEIEPDLCEWRYGRYEGMTTIEIHRENPKWTIFSCGAPGGESREDIRRRCENLLQSWSCSERENILCFAHGHILRALACSWLGQELEFGDCLPLDAASISRLGWEHARPALELWNQCLPTV